MSTEMPEKLAAALEECALHARVLEEDLAEHGDTRYDADTVTRLDRASLRLLDQMAYRFGKLQDAMGQKVLPLLLERAEEREGGSTLVSGGGGILRGRIRALSVRLYGYRELEEADQRRARRGMTSLPG